MAISVGRLLQELDDMPVVLPRIRGVFAASSTPWITLAITLPAVVICMMLINRYCTCDSCATADIYQHARRPLVRVRRRGTPIVAQRRMQMEMVTFSPQADDDDQEHRLPERTPRQGDVLAMC
jgi:hypothetical protein